MEEFKQEVIEKEEVKQEVQEQPKKNKKIMYGILATVVIVAAGIGIYAYNDRQQKQKILDGIQVTFVDAPVIEYGEKDYDLNKLIKEKTDDVILPDTLTTTKLGKQALVYQVEKEGLTKEFTLEAEVKDTKGAEITFKEDAVSLEYGAEFDVAGNIESVKDPVDGDVPYAESAGENNYYIIDGSVDTSTAGEYTITIKAKDKNGIENEKAFTVNVAEEYVAPQAPANNGGGYSQQPSSNGGVNSSPGGNASSGGGGNSPAPSPTCNMSKPAGAYATAEEAYNASVTMLHDGTAPKGKIGGTGQGLFNECNDVVGYTIYWY